MKGTLEICQGIESTKDKRLEMDSTLEMSESLWFAPAQNWSKLRSHHRVSGWGGRWDRA